MADPSLLLQGAIVTVLKAGGGIAGVGARVYDDVPTAAVFPYIVVGDGHVMGDDTECGDGSEVFQQVHAWSRSHGYPEVKAIAAAIRAILKTPPVLAGFTVSVTEFVQGRFMRDPDGETRHVLVEYRYLITHN